MNFSLPDGDCFKRGEKEEKIAGVIIKLNFGRFINRGYLINYIEKEYILILTRMMNSTEVSS